MQIHKILKVDGEKLKLPWTPRTAKSPSKCDRLSSSYFQSNCEVIPFGWQEGGSAQTQTRSHVFTRRSYWSVESMMQILQNYSPMEKWVMSEPKVRQTDLTSLSLSSPRCEMGVIKLTHSLLWWQPGYTQEVFITAPTTNCHWVAENICTSNASKIKMTKVTIATMFNH